MLRPLISNDLFTVSIVIGLILIAISKALFAKRFDDFVFVLGNSKYLKIYSRDQKFFDVFDALLFINFVFTFTIFGILSFETLFGSVSLSLTLLLKLFLAVAIFITMKILIERLIGSVFDIDFLIDNYLFQKISYKNFVGILLLPLNALLIYSIDSSPVIIYSILAIILLVFIIGLLTTLKVYQNLIKQNMFYFILYLCALEIAPYVIIVSVIVDV
ncbi:DUF4271 domain-containing protein [Hanstruepera neustonica]|uniref:DUF4271 domain-containing protein n=1 Tax=Hanstruepera neustonica TaxID=1445657 RepID=A0A2K1E468_9FLAO|nr:DUF4271 domain-containing protein [Hanstruepera neustonica]PNQ75078.1 DUF4271 domain-containing protein [Hanstruepera neustonica]